MVLILNDLNIYTVFGSASNWTKGVLELNVIFLVQSRLGFNNNPSPLEFKHIYRRLLLGVTYGVVNYANIELQDDSEIVSIIPCTQSKIENITETI